jgi:hypothetical protein
MVCPNCYALVQPEDEFCGECGHRLKSATTSEVPVEKPVEGEFQSFSESVPAGSISQPDYLKPGLETQKKKKSKVWIIVLVIVLLCAASVVCALTIGAEFLYDLFNPVIYNGVG